MRGTQLEHLAPHNHASLSLSEDRIALERAARPTRRCRSSASPRLAASAVGPAAAKLFAPPIVKVSLADAGPGKDGGGGGGFRVGGASVCAAVADSAMTSSSLSLSLSRLLARPCPRSVSPFRKPPSPPPPPPPPPTAPTKLPSDPHAPRSGGVRCCPAGTDESPGDACRVLPPPAPFRREPSRALPEPLPSRRPTSPGLASPSSPLLPPLRRLRLPPRAPCRWSAWSRSARRRGGRGAACLSARTAGSPAPSPAPMFPPASLLPAARPRRSWATARFRSCSAPRSSRRSATSRASRSCTRSVLQHGFSKTMQVDYSKRTFLSVCACVCVCVCVCESILLS